MIVLSSNRNLDFCRTSSYEEAKEKKEKKKNVVVPPVASITPGAFLREILLYRNSDYIYYDFTGCRHCCQT